MAITYVRKDYDAATNSYGPEYVVTEYEGRVLEVFGQDYRAMSDVYTFATYARVVTDTGGIDCINKVKGPTDLRELLISVLGKPDRIQDDERKVLNWEPDPSILIVYFDDSIEFCQYYTKQ